MLEVVGDERSGTQLRRQGHAQRCDDPLANLTVLATPGGGKEARDRTVQTDDGQGGAKGELKTEGEQAGGPDGENEPGGQAEAIVDIATAAQHAAQ